jgi:Uma2 family endonuclease
MASTLAAPEVITPEEFLAHYDAGYELLDGVVKERNVSRKSSLTEQKLGTVLGEFNETHGLGEVYSSSLGLQIFPLRPRHVPRADAVFVSKRKLDESVEPDTGFLTVVPDLLAEVVSPNDLAEELDAKVVDYLAAGVRLVWVIYPESRRAIVHRGDGSVSVVNEDGELDGEDVLPGFRCKLSRVLPPVPAAPKPAAG